MGVIFDTNVFISLERNGISADASYGDPNEDVFISAISVSELLVGVHRADSESRRRRRTEFVEAVLQKIPSLDFTSTVARTHAFIQANLSTRGELIGAHDMIIAATAICHDLSVMTENVKEFSRVRGLRVIPFKM